MKKTYIEPNTEVLKIELPILLAGSMEKNDSDPITDENDVFAPGGLFDF